MKNGKGQEARPGTGAEMVIQGTLRLRMSAEKLRELADGKQIRLNWGKARELNLQIEPGPADQIVESCLWFDPDSATVSIDNNIREDSQNSGDDSISLYDFLAITFRESAKSDLGINVTPKQAKALVAVLLWYVQAWEACEALRREPARA